MLTNFDKLILELSPEDYHSRKSYLKRLLYREGYVKKLNQLKLHFTKG